MDLRDSDVSRRNLAACECKLRHRQTQTLSRTVYCAAQQAFPKSSTEYVTAVAEEIQKCSPGRCGELESEKEFFAALRCPKTGAAVCRCGAPHDCSG